MNLVAVEVVCLLPRAITIELLSATFVQVDEGYSLYGCDIGSPFGLRLTDGESLVIVGIARRERHQYGVGSSGAYLADVLTQIGAIAIDGVLLLTALVETNVASVGVNTGNDGTGAFLVEELAIVVMTDRHDDPVARLECLTHGRPQVGIERAGRHASQCLVLYGNLCFVEVLIGIVAPSPLSVGAVALGAIAHGTVAHKEQHWVISFA